MKTMKLFLLLGILTNSYLFAQSEFKKSEKFSALGACCSEPELVNIEKALTIDTIYCYSFDFWTGEEVPYSRTVMSYDGGGRLISSIMEYFWGGTEFVPSRKDVFEYTDFDSIKTHNYYLWSDTLNITGGWILYLSHDKEYNMYNFMIEMETTSISVSTGEISSKQKSEYVYSPNNMIAQINTFLWLKDESKYRNYMQETYLYDESNILTNSYLSYYNMNDEEWFFTNQSIYQVNKTENKMEVLDQYYIQGEDSSYWRNHKRETHELNESGLSTMILYENWNSWEQDWDTLVLEREFYSYDNSMNVTEHIRQSAYIEWFNTDRKTYEYNEDGSIAFENTFQWDFGNEVWKPNRVCEYKYHKTALFISESSDINISIYPNPATDFVLIDLNEAKKYDYEISIFNESGKKLKTIMDSNSSKIKVDLQKIKSKILFIKVLEKNSLESHSQIIFKK